MATLLFFATESGTIYSATLLDDEREPVDGFTGISAVTGVDYLKNHPDTGVEYVDDRLERRRAAGFQ